MNSHELILPSKDPQIQRHENFLKEGPAIVCLPYCFKAVAHIIEPNTLIMERPGKTDATVRGRSVLHQCGTFHLGSIMSVM